MPAARAVRMKSLSSTAIIEARVMRINGAITITAMVSAGSMRRPAAERNAAQSRAIRLSSSISPVTVGRLEHEGIDAVDRLRRDPEPEVEHVDQHDTGNESRHRNPDRADEAHEVIDP